MIEAVLIGVQTAAQVARDYELPTSAIYSSIGKHNKNNDLAVLKRQSEIPEQELARLRAKNHKLKQDRDILKKSNGVLCQPNNRKPTEAFSAKVG